MRSEKVEEFVLFFSQHLANQIALVIRDRRIGEEPLVQQNIFLADKYVEGQHHTSPTAATLEHHTSKSSDDSQELTYETILAQEKPILAIFDERAVADCRGNLQYRRNRHGPWRKSLEAFGKIEWHQRPPETQSRFSVKRMSWSWFSAELIRIWPTEVEFRVKGDAAYLALHNSVRTDGMTTISGGSRSTLTDLRDKLTFVPVGSDIEGWNRFERRMSSVFAVHLISSGSDHDANDISKVPPSLYFENDELKATLKKLQSVLDGTSIDDPAYAETLGLSLLWELRHALDLKHSRMSPVRGGLAVHQLRRVKDFINTQISNEITISDLAVVAGLSQYHFIRAFSYTVGLPPYQYVLSERIHRARTLLSKPDLSLGDVALAVALSDASQLNRVFRKFVGVSPTAYRRDQPWV